MTPIVTNATAHSRGASFGTRAWPALSLSTILSETVECNWDDDCTKWHLVDSSAEKLWLSLCLLCVFCTQRHLDLGWNSVVLCFLSLVLVLSLSLWLHKMSFGPDGVLHPPFSTSQSLYLHRVTLPPYVMNPGETHCHARVSEETSLVPNFTDL